MPKASVESVVDITSEMPLDEPEEVFIKLNNLELLTHLTREIQTRSEYNPEDLNIKIITSDDIVDEITNDYIIASKLQMYIKEEFIQLRTNPEITPGTQSQIITNTYVNTLSRLSNSELLSNPITDSGVTNRLHQETQQMWDQSFIKSPDVPPYDQLFLHVERSLDSSVSNDLQNAFDKLELEPKSERPDPIELTLTIAAKHEAMLTDVTEALENTNFATQGTVSKVKQKLEDEGVITTSSVNIGVGRPRQRLKQVDNPQIGTSLERALKAAD